MVTRPAPVRPVVVTPVDPRLPLARWTDVIPGLLDPSHTTDLFDPARKGRPVVRPDDTAALRIELVHLDILPGTPPRVRAATAQAKAVIDRPPTRDRNRPETCFHGH